MSRKSNFSEDRFDRDDDRSIYFDDPDRLPEADQKLSLSELEKKYILGEKCADCGIFSKNIIAHLRVKHPKEYQKMINV